MNSVLMITKWGKEVGRQLMKPIKVLLLFSYIRILSLILYLYLLY